MWLAGGNTPDHNSIIVQGVLKEVFGQVVLSLRQVISISKTSTDGTKLEANAIAHLGQGYSNNKSRIATS